MLFSFLYNSMDETVVIVLMFLHPAILSASSEKVNLKNVYKHSD